jgi:hypothetical protein
MLLTKNEEIRNMIYTLAVAHLESSKTRLVYCPSSGEPDRQRASSSVINEGDWKFKGLTQANRLIRSEFLPIYGKNLKIEIGMEDLGRYVSFVCSNQYLIPLETYTGTLDVDVSSIGDSMVDILPFIRLAVEAPNLTCRASFQRETEIKVEPRLVSELNEFISAFLSHPDPSETLLASWQIKYERWDFIIHWNKKSRKRSKDRRANICQKLDDLGFRSKVPS